MSEAAPLADAQRLLQAHNQNPGAKRKRSPSSTSAAAPLGLAPAKALKTSNSSSQLQINYIARQHLEDLPFIDKDDTLPGMLDVLSSYTQVLDRHESLASNLGARPLGPILIKRFERCFDAPPRVIASHSHARDQDLPQVTWLDVVHFAQAHPSQFSLTTFSEGRRVCQFYYPQKQVRVQISEEDYLFIDSGRCQDLIPPLPIWEDEEKEVATCEIVEKALRDVTAAADSVAARTRQLAHRLKGRRMAILERRAAEGSHNTQAQPQAQVQPAAPQPMHNAFVSVNAHQPQQAPQQQPQADPGANIRSDLLKHFQSLPRQSTQPENRRISVVQQQQPASPPRATHYQTPPPVSVAPRPQPDESSVSPVPTSVAALAAAAAAQATNQAYQQPQRPLGPYSEPFPSHPSPNMDSPRDAPRHNFSKPLPPSQEVSQPYRAICQAHMESLPRTSRVLPPCDRCRRLKMDCLKNLSSCAGCTKKHARCHWKDVAREEVQGLEGFEDAERLASEYDRRISTEYAASETSMDIDATRRTSAEYETGNTGASVTPAPMQQQRQQYPDPTPQYAPQQQPLPQRSPYEDPTAQPDRRSLPFPEDINQQNHHSMDLLRMLGNDGPRDQGMDLLRMLGNDGPRDQGFSTSAGSVRNNGAFRSVYAANGEGGPQGLAVNGVNGGVEGEGQRV